MPFCGLRFQTGQAHGIALNLFGIIYATVRKSLQKGIDGQGFFDVLLC